MAILNSFPGNVDDSDDPILPPWYIPGWTAQNIEADTVAAPANPFTINQLPSDLVYVTITGNYDDGMGNHLGGYLTFWQSEDLLYGPDPITSQYYRIPKRMVGSVTAQNILAANFQGSGRVYLQFGGIPNVLLLATDIPNVQILEPAYTTTEAGFVAPTTWGYWVSEFFMGGYRYFIQPTISQAGTPVDIHSLIVPGTMEPNHEFNFGR